MFVFNYFRIKLLAWLLFSIAAISQSIAQQSEYSKLGIHIGLSKLEVSNELNSVGYEISAPKALEFGVSYKIYEAKKWKLETIASYRSYSLTNKFNVKSEDIDTNRGFSGSLEFSSFEQFKLNVIPSYTIGHSNFSIGLGPELIIYPSDFVLGTQFAGDEVVYTDDGFSGDDWAYLGLTSQITYNLKFEGFQLRFYAGYHWQPKDLYTVTVVTNDLNVSPDTISKHTITGNYLQFGVGFNPSKKWFGF